MSGRRMNKISKGRLYGSRCDPDIPNPEYSVRVSRRAKHVHLRFSMLKGLEVVVPEGFDRRKIPSVVVEKRAWLERTRNRLIEQRKDLPDGHFDPIPGQVVLRALEEHMEVVYRAAGRRRIRVDEVGGQLEVSGPVTDQEACVGALREWLRDKARTGLVPWLERTSRALGLPYERAVIRGQRTRWGSCSEKKIINLNYKLLFLPPQQVHYLFVHELCHTRHMNHSPRYWALVGCKLPDYARLDAALREAWRYVPAWANA
jgi:predicted metal-dependent hydrolase